MRALVDRIGPSLLALAGALAASALIIALSGGDPAVAFGALVEGAFGSVDSLSEVAVKSCPLLLAGLAIAVSFQAGVWNIGVEGQLLMGALTMAALGTHLPPLPAGLTLAVYLVVAAAAGAVWAGIAGQLSWPRRRRDGGSPSRWSGSSGGTGPSSPKAFPTALKSYRRGSCAGTVPWLSPR